MSTLIPLQQLLFLHLLRIQRLPHYNYSCLFYGHSDYILYFVRPQRLLYLQLPFQVQPQFLLQSSLGWDRVSQMILQVGWMQKMRTSKVLTAVSKRSSIKRVLMIPLLRGRHQETVISPVFWRKSLQLKGIQ